MKHFSSGHSIKRNLIIATGFMLIVTFGVLGYLNKDRVLRHMIRIEPLKDDLSTSSLYDAILSPEEYYRNWKRPDGPLRVGLQVGHWKNQELPDELVHLRDVSTGTEGGGKDEWEVNLAIAVEAKALLEEKGIVVDILPATIPPNYWADALIAIHADGSELATASGYKVSPPRRDLSGMASHLSQLLENTYGESTELPLDPNITSNMRGYYAFNWRRYHHAIHPMTPAVILETGFLTNWSDRRIIVDKPTLVSQAIAEAVFQFLKI